MNDIKKESSKIIPVLGECVVKDINQYIQICVLVDPTESYVVHQGEDVEYGSEQVTFGDE